MITTVIGKSTKIGAGISPKSPDCRCDDLDVLTSPTWYYNWGSESTYVQMNCPSNELPKAEFVPMIWGWWGQKLNSSSIPSDATTILGFNEPNHKSQSNLQPSQAVAGWKVIQATFPDKILVSPAAAPCGGSDCIPNYGQPIAWFDEFFKLCNGECKVDYLATHYYYCNVDDAMEYLNSLKKYNLKIWFTEFNCPGGTPDQQKQFMNELLPKLEESDLIYKYAWFMDRDSGPESLLVYNSTKAVLTSLGEAYNAY